MQNEPPLDLWPYFLTVHDLGGPLDWNEFFGNDHPVEIDIGSGRGLFLVNAGLANPSTNYLGIEIDYKEGRRGARRIKKREMPNVRVLGGDVKVVFDRCVPPGSVSAVHVYFPDPWWKKKHRRRRVFDDVLVQQLAKILKAGGKVHAWSDVEDYFCDIAALMDYDTRFTSLPSPDERPAQHDMDYQTSFERRKRQDNLTIYRGRWQRNEGPLD